MKWLISIVLALALIILGLSIYLQPNSFAVCSDGGPVGERAECQRADAIVAVSGGDTNARVVKAVEMYQQEWADYIIFSGAARDKDGPSNAAAMRVQAINAGVPSEAILVEEYSENTRENALNTRDLLAENTITDIILVTSGYHQRRAYLEFNSFLSSETSVRNAPTADRDWSNWWWITPRGWNLAVGEFGRIIAFYVRGQII